MLIGNRRLVLLVAKVASSLILLLVVTTILYESSHVITATILGIPIASFTWFDPNYFAPSITPGPTENTFGMQIVGYAGGLVTGIILLGILILKRDWFRQSLYKWFLGLSVAAFGVWELSHGILEGAFHDKYIHDVTSIFSSSYYIGHASALLGMVVYWFSMRRLKELVMKEGGSCSIQSRRI